MSERLTFTGCADPEYVQDFLQTALRIRGEALAMRAEEGKAWDLGMRIAFAGEVLPTIDRWVYDARAWLAARSIPCRKASAGGASMAHGCAALASAVGPAPAEAAGATSATPANPLLPCPRGQSLPAAVSAGDTPAAQEAAFR